MNQLFCDHRIRVIEDGTSWVAAGFGETTGPSPRSVPRLVNFAIDFAFGLLFVNVTALLTSRIFSDSLSGGIAELHRMCEMDRGTQADSLQSI